MPIIRCSRPALGLGLPLQARLAFLEHFAKEGQDLVDPEDEHIAGVGLVAASGRQPAGLLRRNPARPGERRGGAAELPALSGN